MDHSSHHMDQGMHGAMDQGMHTTMDHSPGHDHGQDQCTMHMSLTWSYKDTCIIFSGWHLRQPRDLVLSFVAIVVLAYVYEYLKYYVAKFQLNQGPTTPNNQRNYRLANSVWYGVQVGYSFMLMLVFMTYNGWLMLAVVLGAIWGNYAWGSRARGGQEMACH